MNPYGMRPNDPNPYSSYIDDMVQAMAKARALPLGGFSPAVMPILAAGAPRTLVFSPHPDDESIIGALPLRLRQEAGHRVAVVAVTQGSRLDRQAERFQEMSGACQYLDLDLISTGPNGLTNINPAGRSNNPAAWQAAVATVVRILQTEQPKVVFMPHSEDWNTTHIGTHLLVSDALTALPGGYSGWVVETEFWRAMAEPNLMVASSPAQAAALVAAISFHQGEVARNPYHLLLPAWMSDNVRRGGELVAGQGGAVPDFPFATLYRLNRWLDGALVPLPGKQILGPGRDLTALFL